MKKLILIAALVCCAAVSVNAQMKIYSNGTARIGRDYFEENLMTIPGLMDSTTMLRVLGQEYLGANAHISFGAQYYESVKTVMVGDSYSPSAPSQINNSVLWLHGANGFNFTQNPSANDTIFNFDSYDSQFNFKYPVRAEGILLTSDERLKENVNRVEGALDAVSELNGVTYNYVPRKSPMGDFVPKSEYEQKYKDYFDKYYADLESQRSAQTHYGFIAQQVQEVLPELVHADKDGMLSVDYIGVIPLLVNAIQELKGRLEQVEAEKEMATPAVNHAPAVTATADVLAVPAAEVLSQNDPNPFSSDTRIAYNLPEGTQQAAIYIYDLQGKQVKRLDVSPAETGTMLHGGDLQAGMYIYSLIADGKELASKKMILTK